MKKNIRMKIKSIRYEMPELLFSQAVSETAEEMFDMKISEEILASAEDDAMVINTDGILSVEDGRVDFAYDESEITGMEGSKTSLSYDESNPSLVTMIRTGTVSTSLVFEQGKRHHCVYKTPYMPFEVCVHTLKVDNKLDTEKSLYIDYIIEIRGAKAERTKLTMTYFE
ncbi:MAG: DUF1934 domain-containing protein [Clostridia bacterium]|nr:DUF1934 domain-containing protein [Clostridia bacterium]